MRERERDSERQRGMESMGDIVMVSEREKSREEEIDTQDHNIIE